MPLALDVPAAGRQPAAVRQAGGAKADCGWRAVGGGWQRLAAPVRRTVAALAGDQRTPLAAKQNVGPSGLTVSTVHPKTNHTVLHDGERQKRKPKTTTSCAPQSEHWKYDVLHHLAPDENAG